MIFSWHCRECNASGQKSVTLQELREFDKTESNILKLLISFVKRTIHKGCTGDIGVKAI